MNAPQSELTKAEATRLRILDAAAGLFWRRSFHGVSIDEIAARSEVNKATIYRYYLDKSELALAAIAHNGDTVLEEIFVPVFEHYRSAEDRLERVFLCLYEAHRAFEEREDDLFGCPIAGLALELGQDMPDLRAEAQKIFDKIEAHMLEIAMGAPQPQASAREIARMLVQLLHGAFTSARLSVDPLRVVDAGNAALILLGSERRIAVPKDRRIS